MSLEKRIDGALVRQAAKRSLMVRRALAASIDIGEIVTRFLNDFPEGSTLTTPQGRAWARAHIIPDTRPMEAALREIHAIGWLLGDQSAKAHYAAARMSKAVDWQTALSIDWNNWSPGNEAASLLVSPPGALASLLAKRKIEIKNIMDTTLDRIGTILADGLAVGSTSVTVAKEFIRAGIEGIAENPSRALTIATTEMSAAMNTASVETYQDLSVEMVEWLGIEPCEEICLDNDGQQVPIGDAFASGDTEPPAHPNCRCVILPVIEGLKSAEISKGVPGPLDIALALSRLAILPNPNEMMLEAPEKWVESPWRQVQMPTIDPGAWDAAQVEVVSLDELLGTDPYLNRKKIAKHIEALGQALSPNRSLALIVEIDAELIIVDGHHRLMAWWLLGQDQAPVWKVSI